MSAALLSIARARAAARALWPLLLLGLGLSGCHKGVEPSPGADGDGGVRATSASAPGLRALASPGGGDKASTAATAARRGVAFDFLNAVDQCVFFHKGPLLDFGESGLRVRGSHNEDLPSEMVEREGASFARIREKNVNVPFFVSPEEERAMSADPTSLTVRLRGGLARSISWFVNGKPVGTSKLVKNETKVMTVTAPASLLVAGTNELTLHFSAPPRTEREVMAEIDWVHLGAGEPEKNFAAPTTRDVMIDRPIAGRLEKTFALQNGSGVRCMGYLPAGGALEFDLGAEGAGEVEVEARLLRDRDRVAPTVLGRATLSVASGGPGESAAKRFSLGSDVLQSGGTIGAIELAVTRTTKGARALFGEPRVVVDPPAERAPSAPLESVVLVVFGSTEPQTLVPYGGTLGAESIAALAKEGTVFTQHRSSSSLPNATMAAMFSGRSPHALRLEDGEARLPASVTTIVDAARQAGLVTGYFTGNPLTTAPYGFDRSWETQAAFLPDVDPQGTRPFDEAAGWIHAHKDARFLVVIHARGGHPPWSATPDQIKTMAPENYAGGLDPKHAGELLAKARHVPPLLRFTDADRTRAFALHGIAIADQDRALSRVLAEVHSAGRDDQTLVVVTSDMGVSTGANIPFGDGEAPSEPILATPLIVRGKGVFPAGASVSSPTEDLDIAKTVVGALGLKAPASFEGVDLASVAAAPSTTLGRSLFASVLGRHSLRWGSLVLESSDRRELLCDVALEPLCTTDVRPTHPLALLVLARRLAQEKAASGIGAVAREPAVLDAHLQGELRAWGR